MDMVNASINNQSFYDVPDAMNQSIISTKPEYMQLVRDYNEMTSTAYAFGMGKVNLQEKP